MKFIVQPSSIGGGIDVPGSKSHTIRALAFALLAEGTSVVRRPLDSADTRSCAKMAERFGARVGMDDGAWTVTGAGGSLPVPEDVINTGNSGTGLYIGMGLAALVCGTTVLTGDAQIRSRPAQGLIDALNSLGAETWSTRNNGSPPVVVRGPMRGGAASVEAVTSQYLTSLLIAAPFAPGNTEIVVPLLNERPYVEMTLAWTKRMGVRVEHDGFSRFRIQGGQRCRAFDAAVPADFSSATFFMVAAAILGAEVTLRGLDPSDTQGDREVAGILGKMGARVETAPGAYTVRGGSLTGGVFDLNAMPDALPALAVAGCFAGGETRLVNVAQARVKETDRIAVMCAELRKMGADIEELADGILVRGRPLRGAEVQGHGDHRVVMSLAVAGLAASGKTAIDTAECVSVTFPGFMDLVKSLGGNISIEEE